MTKKNLLLIGIGCSLVLLSACTKPDATENSVQNSLVNFDVPMTTDNQADLNNEAVDLPLDQQLNLNDFQAAPTPADYQKPAPSNLVEEDQPVRTINSPADWEDLYKAGYNQAIIKTNFGDITVELFGDKSPNTVNNFLNLATTNFYNDIKFHRVMKGFMVQVGDPITKTTNITLYGTGGPDYRFADEINDILLVKGSLAMANAGPDTNGSQFFIVTAEDTPWLDGKHTNFGKVIAGMEVVERIENARVNANNLPLSDIIIESVEILKK